jgi:hypothetical protein
VFTARYALSPYIKQIRFVFKGLIGTTEYLTTWTRCRTLRCCYKRVLLYLFVLSFFLGFSYDVTVFAAQTSDVIRIVTSLRLLLISVATHCPLTFSKRRLCSPWSYAVWYGRHVPMFQRNALPPLSHDLSWWHRHDGITTSRCFKINIILITPRIAIDQHTKLKQKMHIF